MVPRAAEPVEARLIPAKVEGDQVLARLHLRAARLRGSDGPTSWDGTLAVVPDPETRWRFTQPSPALLQRLRVDSWKQDIAFVRAELPRRHVNAFQEVRRQQFEGALAALEGALPRLADHQIEVGLMSAVALLGDTHTSLNARFQSGGHRARVVRRRRVRHARRPAAQRAGAHPPAAGGHVPGGAGGLAGAGGVSPPTATPACYYLAPWYLTQPGVLHAVGLARRPDAAFYAFQRPDGHEVNLELALPEPGKTLRWPDRPSPMLRERQPERPFWFQRLTRGRALYVKYNQCQDPAGFQQMTDKLLAILDRGGIDRVVVDVRDNEGGDSAVIEPLLIGLADRRARAKSRFEILGLIGRRTFSSGMWSAIHLRKRLGATLIGEPTWGKPNSPGEVQSVKLPVSGLELQYSTRNWLRDPGNDAPSLMPDLTVVGKAADYFARRDVVLDAALGFTSKPTAPSSPRRPATADVELGATASR